MAIASARRQAPDFGQLKPKGFDLATTPRSAAWSGSIPSARCPSARLRAEGGERGAHRLVEVAADQDLVLPRLRPAVCAGHGVTSRETSQLPTVVRHVRASW